MNRVDLEITPIESSIGVVVVDLAFALGVFRALNGEGDAAVLPKLAAGVLLPGGKAAAMLIGLGLMGENGVVAFGDDEGQLQAHDQGVLQADGIAGVEPSEPDGKDHSDGQGQEQNRTRGPG